MMTNLWAKLDEMKAEGILEREDVAKLICAVDADLAPPYKRMADEQALAEPPPSRYLIGRLTLGPGDVLVLKYDCPVSATFAAQLREVAKTVLGNTPILILDSTLEIAVLTKADIEERVDPERKPPERIIDLP